jgi:hypothetical protein
VLQANVDGFYRFCSFNRRIAMRIAAIVCFAAGAVLWLAPPLRAQDTCPTDLKKLQSAVKDTTTPGAKMPALSSSQLEKQIKVMEDCRWNHSGGTDNPEPYAEMRDQLTDELLGRYRTFLVKHNLIGQLEREEAAGSQ